MNFFRFLASKIFLKNLLIAAIIAIILFIGAFIWLKVYTHHGKTITVPDLTGLTEEEIQIIIDSKDLRYEIIDSIFYKELPRGTVAKQNPEPGTKVKENRRIYIIMNAFNPEKVIMPNVTGVSLRQARAVLNSYSLNLGNISYKPNLAVNVVLEQRYKDSLIDPGTMIIKGAQVDLVLGKGLSNETSEVPNLIGLNLVMAKDFLADKYLNTGAVIYDNTVKNDEDTSMAFIWRQRPLYENGNKLQMGSSVDVWLTIDSTKLPVPDTMRIEETEMLFDEDVN